VATVTPHLRQELSRRGIECFIGEGGTISDHAVFEPPCGLKWMATHHTVSLGAFSYAVSGFYSEVMIGRYCSFGDNVQVGRGAHPVDWMSTSPFFYAGERLFNIGTEFEQSAEYTAYRPGHPGDIPVRNSRTVNDFLKRTTIGHDVWIGHGAFIAPGVTIGNGAVVAGQAVVTKDVPPYAIVGGNPAQILRMRFDLHKCAALQALAWWRFAPWQLAGVPFADVGKAIPQLRTLIADLTPYAPAKVRIADITAAQ
jgi:acetyltransferase-like isoleucine patch superfamily enzyme